ncbi:hypothetical protein FOZ61_003912, partial [Perkinsus olseni]
TDAADYEVNCLLTSANCSLLQSSGGSVSGPALVGSSGPWLSGTTPLGALLAVVSSASRSDYNGSLTTKFLSGGEYRFCFSKNSSFESLSYVVFPRIIVAGIYRTECLLSTNPTCIADHRIHCFGLRGQTSHTSGGCVVVYDGYKDILGTFKWTQPYTLLDTGTQDHPDRPLTALQQAQSLPSPVVQRRPRLFYVRMAMDVPE